MSPSCVYTRLSSSFSSNSCHPPATLIFSFCRCTVIFRSEFSLLSMQYHHHHLLFAPILYVVVHVLYSRTYIFLENIPIRWSVDGGWLYAIRVSWRRLSIVQELVYRCDDARCASHDFVYPSLTILRRPEVRHSSQGYEI